MSDNLLGAGSFKKQRYSSNTCESSGIINNNGGNGTIAHLDIPEPGFYLINATGWNLKLPDGKRLENGHLALIVDNYPFSQQGITPYTFSITGMQYISKENSRINLVLSNWDQSSVNMSTTQMINFKFIAVRVM